MLTSRIHLRSLSLLLGLTLCLLAPAAASAGTPASVTVRVEGLTETKLPATAVTTTTTPVVKDNDPADACSGTSALGALQLATAGNWDGPWEATYNQYSIYTIEGETHEFEESSSANYYWSFWLDNQESSVGACEAELQTGDQVLFFPSCYGSACPPVAATPLGLEAPSTANLGEAVPVTVKQYNAKGEAAPAVGASIAANGGSATTDSQGHATLTFAAKGTFTLTANGSSTGPPAVRDEASICVHEGNDGTCGTTFTPGEVPKGGTALPLPIAIPRHAMMARVTGVLNHHTYAARLAPRVLAGAITASEPLASISLRLRRRNHKRCWSYSGKREQLVRAGCGSGPGGGPGGSFFTIPVRGASFSYLLPARLPRGRYLYEVTATDIAGDQAHTAKIVFYVK